MCSTIPRFAQQGFIFRKPLTFQANYLRSLVSANEPIYVAASSGVLNDSILWEAERIFHENDKKLDILDADKRSRATSRKTAL